MPDPWNLKQFVSGGAKGFKDRINDVLAQVEAKSRAEVERMVKEALPRATILPPDRQAK